MIQHQKGSDRDEEREKREREERGRTRYEGSDREGI